MIFSFFWALLAHLYYRDVGGFWGQSITIKFCKKFSLAWDFYAAFCGIILFMLGVDRNCAKFESLKSPHHKWTGANRIQSACIMSRLSNLGDNLPGTQSCDFTVNKTSKLELNSQLHTRFLSYLLLIDFWKINGLRFCCSISLQSSATECNTIVLISLVFLHCIWLLLWGRNS